MMNEDGFLSFVPFGIAAAVLGTLLFRSWEATLSWERYRPSVVLPTALPGLIIMGFINMSDSLLLLGLYLLVSAPLALLACCTRSLSGFDRILLAIVAFLPFSGWFFFGFRFPHLHGIDANAERLGLDPSEILPRF